jgi:RNA-binding protein
MAPMTQKRMPSRRTTRPSSARTGGAARPASSSTSPYRPKRVRAGGTPAKPRKRRVSEPAAKAAPLVAPELTEKQRRHLRGLAHDLKPIIRLGNAGLTEAVATETARALYDHELIKVRGPGGDREARDAVFTDLAQRTASTLVHRIGNVAVLYRPNQKLAKILIPDGI